MYIRTFFLIFNAPIAQLDRVPDFESVGCRFDSYWAHHCKRSELSTIKLNGFCTS